MEVRNAMVLKYRESPTKPLSFLEAAKALSVSMDQLVAVWTFLDSWGIINFTATECADAEQSAPQAATDTGES